MKKETFIDECNDYVNSLESQYLAMLSSEYAYDIIDGTQEQADNTFQKIQNENYRLSHPTIPDKNDIQHVL